MATTLIPGIVNRNRLIASQAVAASTVLVTLGANTANNSFVFPLAALQKIHIRLHGLFTLGATGGFKFQWTVPATPGNIQTSFVVYDCVTTAVLPNAVIAQTAFANALAVAGTHYLDTEIDYVNGVAAGNISFQFACNSAANGITMLQGAWAEFTQV